MSRTDSGDSVEDSVRARIEIDADSDGFVLLRELPIPSVGVNYLYEHPETGFNRLYDGVSGKRIGEDYFPNGHKKGSKKFFSPEQSFNFSRGISNTWRGKGSTSL